MTYNRDGKAGGNSNKKYARRAPGGRSFGDKPEMHRAICSECDKECEVPFKPSGDKPVFCRTCFKGKEDSGPRESFGGKRDFGGERSFSDRKMHKTVCSACGKTCEVPFRPSGEKPIYCNNCFGANYGKVPGKAPSTTSAHSTGGGSMTKEQFEILNSKLDKILKAIEE